MPYYGHDIGREDHVVQFQRKNNTYRWTGESEMFFGPKRFKDTDGVWENEFVAVVCTPSNGNHVNVEYSGSDSRFVSSTADVPMRDDLTLREVVPILHEWHYSLPREVGYAK